MVGTRSYSNCTGSTAMQHSYSNWNVKYLQPSYYPTTYLKSSFSLESESWIEKYRGSYPQSHLIYLSWRMKYFLLSIFEEFRVGITWDQGPTIKFQQYISQLMHLCTLTRISFIIVLHGRDQYLVIRNVYSIFCISIMGVRVSFLLLKFYSLPRNAHLDYLFLEQRRMARV